MSKDQFNRMEMTSTTWKLTGLTFNGMDSQIVVPFNPLAGAGAFTIEALFQPASGGAPEQRFVHVQGEDESRALLELRATDMGWYADTFVHFAAGERFLNDPDRRHPFGEWHILALVYTGSELRQYVNGRLELSAPAASGRLGAGSVSLGMRLNRISPFKGRLAEVRFTPMAVPETGLMRLPN